VLTAGCWLLAAAGGYSVVQETVVMEGHLIDSDVMRKAFNRIVEEGGEFEILEFKVGKTNDEASLARLAVRAGDPHALDRILEALAYLGAQAAVEDARFAPAEADGILPDEFYSTANFDTLVRRAGRWEPVRDQKMDCAIAIRDGSPSCVKQGQIRKGEPVALRGPGIRVRPLERSRDYSVFGFMSNEISAEVNKGIVIAGTAREMRKTRAAGEKTVVVAGPAIVHSGGDVFLARLVRDGWVDVLLSGNAFAVHDLEKAILKTSLGVCQMSGRAVEGGSRNHLYAINAVNRAGGIRPAVASGVVAAGVMYEVVKKGIPYVLAGSIRDDGPLKDTITDMVAAQKAYVEALRGAGLCLMLASALHSIAVGNLLPARVRTVCVDMTESVPVKLSNRGTLQAVGLVTDVGFFLERLAAELGQGESGRSTVDRHADHS
jgi:lysine-ketoglutarate reductase/saccharopine dehydrogenase-like protein (TIGR00300 family)